MYCIAAFVNHND